MEAPTLTPSAALLNSTRACVQGLEVRVGKRRALEFYKKCLNAEVTGLVRWKNSPDAAMKALPGCEEKIMSAAFRIGTTKLMAADDVEAKRVFTAPGEGDNVMMPLMKTFWTLSFGMLTDKFGVPWMVNVAVAKA